MWVMLAILEQAKSLVYLITINADNLPCVKGPGLGQGYMCDTKTEATLVAAIANVAFEEGKKIKT